MPEFQWLNGRRFTGALLRSKYDRWTLDLGRQLIALIDAEGRAAAAARFDISRGRVKQIESRWRWRIERAAYLASLPPPDPEAEAAEKAEERAADKRRALIAIARCMREPEPAIERPADGSEAPP